MEPESEFESPRELSPLPKKRVKKSGKASDADVDMPSMQELAAPAAEKPKRVRKKVVEPVDGSSDEPAKPKQRKQPSKKVPEMAPAKVAAAARHSGAEAMQIDEPEPEPEPESEPQPQSEPELDDSPPPAKSQRSRKLPVKTAQTNKQAELRLRQKIERQLKKEQEKKQRAEEEFKRRVLDIMSEHGSSGGSRKSYNDELCGGNYNPPTVMNDGYRPVTDGGDDMGRPAVMPPNESKGVMRPAVMPHPKQENPMFRMIFKDRQQ